MNLDWMKNIFSLSYTTEKELPSDVGFGPEK